MRVMPCNKSGNRQVSNREHAIQLIASVVPGFTERQDLSGSSKLKLQRQNLAVSFKHALCLGEGASEASWLTLSASLSCADN